jgi:hypothetical protein
MTTNEMQKMEQGGQPPAETPIEAVAVTPVQPFQVTTAQPAVGAVPQQGLPMHQQQKQGAKCCKYSHRSKRVTRWLETNHDRSRSRVFF